MPVRIREWLRTASERSLRTVGDVGEAVFVITLLAALVFGAGYIAGQRSVVPTEEGTFDVKDGLPVKVDL